jgi:hypothetical protein
VAADKASPDDPVLLQGATWQITVLDQGDHLVFKAHWIDAGGVHQAVGGYADVEDLNENPVRALADMFAGMAKIAAS